MLDNIRFINRLSYLIWVIGLIICIFSGVYYIAQNCFPINKITIEGDVPHITEQQLSYIASHRLTGTLFTLDIDSLQQEFHKIPWVSAVTVLREFPDAITVHIVEYKAIARLGEDGLVSSEGKFFNGAYDNADLPVFYAPKSQIANLIDTYADISKILNTHNLVVKKIIYSGSGFFKIYLSNNLELVFCGDGVVKNVRLLNSYWDQLVKIKPELTYINMCYQNAVAIR